MRRWSLVLILCGLLLTGISISYAQTQTPPVCPGLNAETIAKVQQNCGFDKLEPYGNSACYANEAALFSLTTGEVPSLGTVVSLQAVQSIRTAANGVAVLNVQPEAANAESFFVLVVGEAELEQAGTDDATGAPAYFVRTNTGGCSSGVPAAVGIVSRGGERTINFTMNGASITQGSVTIFRIVAPGNTLQLITTEGNAFIETDAGPDTVSAGETSFICLAEADNLGLDGEANDKPVQEGCNWSTPRPLNEEETAYSAAFQAIIGGTPVVGGTCPNGGTTVVHTVLRGETLGRIATRYRTTARDIALKNNIVNIDAIYPGQQLTIECGVDTGRSTFPPFIPTQPPHPST